MAAGAEIQCPGCGKRIDPLRAGVVAVLGERFAYFCGVECKQRYLREANGSLPDDVATAAPPDVAPVADPPARPLPPAPRPDTASRGQAARPPANVPEASVAVSRPAPASAAVVAPPPARAGKVPDAAGGDRVLFAVDMIGVLVGVLAPAIGLLTSVAPGARLPLVVVAWIALVARVVRAGRDAADPHPLIVLAPTGAAVVAACWSNWADDPHTAGISALAGLGAAAAIVSERMIGSARSRMRAARRRIEEALHVDVRAVQDGEAVERPASEIRPGEGVVVEAGEVVGVDGVVAAGEARVLPWLGATIEAVRREGDPVVAGARVTSSRLRLTTTWAGRERAWVKLLSTPSTRIDVVAPTSRAMRQAVERGTPIAAALAAMAAFAENAPAVEVFASAAAAALALGGRVTSSFVGLLFARAHLDALASGITYRDAQAFERAASTDVVVLNARGTVLLGEPEIATIEGIAPSSSRGERAGDSVAPRGERAGDSVAPRGERAGDSVAPRGERAGDSVAPRGGSAGALDASRVLALAAGAQTASSDPVAVAVVRASRERGVRPDPVRNATAHVGLGVTALASSGERLVVGGRALMLEEKIGVAVADARVTALEGEGLSVLLVALGERVVGLIALQDGLRLGARAAVQSLLDAGVEPVLLGGEARETCETLGRALDIEHVRPEVLPSDRGAEVKALAGGGAVVAVVGHPAVDDAALGAADVAIAMRAAGSTPGEWAVALASDDVRDCAKALSVPKAARGRVRVVIAFAAVPAAVALLAIGYGVAPLAMAPLAALLGSAAISIHARETGAR